MHIVPRLRQHLPYTPFLSSRCCNYPNFEIDKGLSLLLLEYSHKHKALCFPSFTNRNTNWTERPCTSRANQQWKQTRAHSTHWQIKHSATERSLQSNNQTNKRASDDKSTHQNRQTQPVGLQRCVAIDGEASNSYTTTAQLINQPS